MACKKWKAEWVASLYDELEAAEHRGLSEHLQQCPACRETLEQLAGIGRLLRDSAPAVPGAPRVVVLRRARRLAPAWSFAAGVACAALLFLGGTLAGPRLWGASDPGPGFERRLTRMQEQIDVNRVRDVEFLLDEIDAAERRAGTWVGETREALRLVALQNDPRITEW